MLTRPIEVFENGRSACRYEYDALGRLTREDNVAFGKTTTWAFDSNGNLIKQSNGLEFLYDHTGVFAVKYDDKTYFYRKDAQANIVALLDNARAVVVKYKYDAWGNCKVLNASGVEITDKTHIGVLNPFRYRSYYFDTETGFYFLKTRYYDPEIGRFMTIDDISYLDPESINGLNLYEYCGNNPVMNIDPIGKAFLSALIVSIIIGAVISGAISGVTAYNEGVRGIGLIGSILGGAIMGAAMGAILTIGGAAGLASLGVSIAGYTLNSAWIALGVSVAIGVGAGVASYGVENGLREDRTLSAKGFIFAGLSGGLKGAATFGIGFVGGKFGAFDKIFLNDILKGAYTISTSATYELAKGIMASAFPSIGRTILTTSSFYIGEFLTKLLFVSSTAAASRWIIDQFFDS